MNTHIPNDSFRRVHQLIPENALHSDAATALLNKQWFGFPFCIVPLFCIEISTDGAVFIEMRSHHRVCVLVYMWNPTLYCRLDDNTQKDSLLSVRLYTPHTHTDMTGWRIVRCGLQKRVWFTRLARHTLLDSCNLAGKRSLFVSHIP